MQTDLAEPERPTDPRSTRPRPVEALAAHWPYILCLGVALLLLLVIPAWPVGEDEPRVLRWMRCCADHPLRTLAALLLLLCATLPRRTPT